MEKLFKIGSLYGSYFTCRDPEAGDVFRNVAICRDDIDGVFTCVRAIITAGCDGRVEVAWDHETSPPAGFRRNAGRWRSPASRNS